MGFDAKRFGAAKYEPRIVKVPVPDLKGYFGEDEEPVMTVRGLAGSELARVHEAVKTNRDMAAVVEGLVSGHGQEKIAAVRDLIGMTDKVPDEAARRLEMLIIGGVDPAWDRPAALKFCEAHPAEFYLLTNAITTATGGGKIPVGKSKPSGGTTE